MLVCNLVCLVVSKGAQQNTFDHYALDVALQKLAGVAIHRQVSNMYKHMHVHMPHCSCSITHAIFGCWQGRSTLTATHSMWRCRSSLVCRHIQTGEHVYEHIIYTYALHTDAKHAHACKLVPSEARALRRTPSSLFDAAEALWCRRNTRTSHAKKHANIHARILTHTALTHSCSYSHSIFFF